MTDILDNYKARLSARTERRRLNHSEAVTLWRQEAYTAIVERLQPFIFSSAMKYQRSLDNTTLESSDLLSIATIAAYKAVKSWKPTGLALTTWVHRHIKTEVSRAISRERVSTVSIDHTLEQIEQGNYSSSAHNVLAHMTDDGSDPALVCQQQEDCARAVSSVSSLPRQQGRALQGKTDGMSNKKLAKDLGISEPAVSRLLKRARNNLGKGVNFSA